LTGKPLKAICDRRASSRSCPFRLTADGDLNPEALRSAKRQGPSLSAIAATESPAGAIELPSGRVELFRFAEPFKRASL